MVFAGRVEDVMGKLHVRIILYFSPHFVLVYNLHIRRLNYILGTQHTPETYRTFLILHASFDKNTVYISFAVSLSA